MSTTSFKDWGEASSEFDEIASFVSGRNLTDASEAQTRFDVIDRIVKSFLGWQHGQISVEESEDGDRTGFVDYILRAGDNTLVIEAKKIGSTFPSPTKKKQLKLTGAVLSKGEIAKAIDQGHEYARGKKADVLIVTNALCWCFYSVKDRDPESYAYLLFPFDQSADGAESLFNFFAESQVESGSLTRIVNRLPRTEDRLLSVLHDADGRVDRNNIADHIIPALDKALYADALLADPDALKKCFVTTEARSKFDTHLGIHLADPKPLSVRPARRIRTGKNQGRLQEIVERSVPSHAPPVTLIIGPVGAGKSIYLKHFELVSGQDVIKSKKAHWIYIDFEHMGPGGKSRNFIYSKLREYLGGDHPDSPTDYKHAVRPAYANEIDALARGPLAPIREDVQQFNAKVSEFIFKEFEAVEPYVDKILGYIADRELCVVVLDNVDLAEDEKLETEVFAEGLALSKRIHCHIIVCVRDKTFVRHKTKAAFDAYELRKLWLDPPGFQSVLSSRLAYSKVILKNKRAEIPMGRDKILQVRDMSKFFEIVQRSLMSGSVGEWIGSFADTNIRKGLNLVTNFLTSGHIQADRAIKLYLGSDPSYTFPPHEIFKGTMLGQWKYYKEGRAECINLFDARLGARRLRLLRLFLLEYLLRRARTEDSLEVSVGDCIKKLSECGASESQVLGCLSTLERNGLVRSVNAEDITADSTIVATRCGGYYVRILCRLFSYAEACMFDTAIENEDVWTELRDLTLLVEQTHSVLKRMDLRVKRIHSFMDYLVALERDVISESSGLKDLAVLKVIREFVLEDAGMALEKTKRYHS